MKVIKCERCKQLKRVNKRLDVICGLYTKGATYVHNANKEWLDSNLERLEWERAKLEEEGCTCVKVYQPPLSNTGVKI